tara:strand:+ start:392 stop:1396 length:1005 start_codon:yes stop_codon:yes gene_type:complete
MQLVHMQSPATVGARFWSEVLMESGAWYVSLSDGEAGTDAEEPIFAVHKPGSKVPELEKWEELLEARHLWSNTSLEVGFPVGADVEATLMLAAASADLDVLPRFQIEDLAPRDWVTKVQSNWPPITIPGCLLIRFPWHPPAAELLSADGEASTAPPLEVLTLHPGMAFGTGEHATTQLCCEAIRDALARPELRGCELLDYGSGSGVLAFAALRFGADKAVGVEIDPDAVTTSVRNAEENGLHGCFEAMLPEQEEEGATYPLVVANILAGTLVQLQPVMAARTAPGGTLLLSGIWGEQQAAQVREAYAADFAVDETRVQDDWRCIRLTRTPAGAA